MLAAIDKVPFWWHTMELAPGVKTPGQTPESAQETRLASIPEELSDKRVLDIGCWDGFFSFRCEQRGAEYVLGIDNRQQEEFVRSKYGIELDSTRGFQVAREAFGSSVDYRVADFFDLDPEQPFDVVLFLGVLYHTRHPLLALERLYELTEDLLVLESHYVREPGDPPLMRFYGSSDLNDDPTNWWGPTIPCILQMCEAVGFARVAVVDEYYDNDYRVVVHCRKR